MSVSKEELIHAAATYGTPLYVYHAESISGQYQKLMDAFSQLNARFLCRQGADQSLYFKTCSFAGMLH